MAAIGLWGTDTTIKPGPRHELGNVQPLLGHLQRDLQLAKAEVCEDARELVGVQVGGVGRRVIPVRLGAAATAATGAAAVTRCDGRVGAEVEVARLHASLDIDGGVSAGALAVRSAVTKLTEAADEPEESEEEEAGADMITTAGSKRVGETERSVNQRG